MAKIRVDVTGVLENGRLVTFKAPCDCTEIDGLIVYHTLPSDRYNNDSRVGQEFTLCDSHGCNLIGLGNLFTAGALVHVILDTADKKAYVQNAATNSYIESRLASFEDGCKVFVDDLATHGVELDGNSSPQEIVDAYNGLIGGGGGGSVNSLTLVCGLMGYINNRYAATANTGYVTKNSDTEYTAVKDFDAAFLSDFGIRDSSAGTYKLYAKVNGTNVLEHSGSSSAKLNAKSVICSIKTGDVITFSITSVSNSAGSVMCYAI